MNHAKVVMRSKAFRSKSKSSCGRHCYVLLHPPGRWNPLTVRGHTWNEAFRKAAIALVTNRLSH